MYQTTDKEHADLIIIRKAFHHVADNKKDGLNIDQITTIIKILGK